MLATEVFTQMCLKDQSVGLLNGLCVSPHGLGFPNLQYTDDALLFTNGDVNEARVVKNILI